MTEYQEFRSTTVLDYLLNKTIVIAITLLLWHPVYTFAIEITLGEDTLQVIAPTGFVDVKSVSMEQYKFFEDFLPGKTNRLITAFVSEQDAGRLMLGESAVLNQYFLILSSRELESTIISKAQFTEIRKMFRKEYQTMFQKQEKVIGELTTQVGKSLSESLGEKLEFNLKLASELIIMDKPLTYPLDNTYNIS